MCVLYSALYRKEKYAPEVELFYVVIFDLPFCFSAFNLQILMSVRRAQTSVMEASVPTPRGRTSVYALTVSCHLKI